MKYAASRRKRMPKALVPAIAGGAVLIVLILLFSTGVLSLQAFGIGKKPGKKRFVPPAGYIAIPASGMAIPAYTRVTRDYLWDAKEGDFAVVYVNPSQISPNILTSLHQIVGRVINHDKPAGYAFTKSDLLPEGTRSGLVGGVPSGKRAMRIPTDKVDGLFGLQAGDRFDIVASIAIDPSVGKNVGAAGTYAKQLQFQNQITNFQKQATVRIVVQSGVVVEGVRTRMVPVSSSSVFQGNITRTKPVQDMVVAVDPEEVAKLAEAMAVGAQISCVLRSGRPDDPADSLTPDLEPWSPFSGTMGTPGGDSGKGASGFSAVESISGTRREIVAVPR